MWLPVARLGSRGGHRREHFLGRCQGRATMGRSAVSFWGGSEAATEAVLPAQQAQVVTVRARESGSLGDCASGEGGLADGALWAARSEEKGQTG